MYIYIYIHIRICIYIYIYMYTGPADPEADAAGDPPSRPTAST